MHLVTQIFLPPESIFNKFLQAQILDTIMNLFTRSQSYEGPAKGMMLSILWQVVNNLSTGFNTMTSLEQVNCLFTVIIGVSKHCLYPPKDAHISCYSHACITVVFTDIFLNNCCLFAQFWPSSIQKGTYLLGMVFPYDTWCFFDVPYL